MRLLIQIVYLNQSNSSGVVYTVDNRGVVARLQISNDRRLACRSRSAATVLNVADLIAGDNPADDRGPPIITCSPVCTRLRVLMLPRATPGEAATVACSPSIATPSWPSPAMRVIVA